jgi:hypothetical protein
VTPIFLRRATTGTRRASFKSDTRRIGGKFCEISRSSARVAHVAHSRTLRGVRRPRTLLSYSALLVRLSRVPYPADRPLFADRARLTALAPLLLLLACSESAPGSNATTGSGGNSGASSSGNGGAAAGGASAGSAALAGGAAAGQTAGGAQGGDSAGTSAGGLGGDSTGNGGSGGSAGGSAISSLPDCALQFPYQDEPALGTWLGGDSAYSLVLDEHTALWTFQDTFVGKHGQTGRQGAGMIANSYAYVTCQAGVGKIQYFWRHADGGAQAVMADGVPNTRFWPQQPFLYGGYLFQAMTRVQGGADEIGTVLARVKNPLDTPDTWQVEYFELASLPGLGKGTLVVDDYAYLFGNAGEAVVTRLPLAELVKPSAAPKTLLQYLASDGTWKAGLDTDDAKKLGFSANVGTSFRYLSQAKTWLVLFTNTAGWPAPNISISTAPALEGPWSKPVDVYRVPEMTPGKPEYDPDTVCYAAIEHVESNPSPEMDLLFSYTCNSLVFDKQLANLGIYLPKIVRMKRPG